MPDNSRSNPVQLTDYLLPLLTFVASWGLGAYLFTKFPAQVAVHWGLNGEPDRYGSRFEAAFLAPIMLTLLLLLFVFLSRSIAGRPIMKVAGIIGLFILAVQGVIALNAFGIFTDVATLVFLLMAVLFIALGVIIPSFPPNKFGGFRDANTLSDPEIWKSTNRLGGRMMVICGILMVPLAFTPPLVGFIGMIVLVLVGIVIVPLVHSTLAAARKARED